MRMNPSLHPSGWAQWLSGGLWWFFLETQHSLGWRPADNFVHIRTAHNDRQAKPEGKHSCTEGKKVWPSYLTIFTVAQEGSSLFGWYPIFSHFPSKNNSPPHAIKASHGGNRSGSHYGGKLFPTCDSWGWGLVGGSGVRENVQKEWVYYRCSL